MRKRSRLLSLNLSQVHDRSPLAIYALTGRAHLDRPEDGYGLNETVWPEGARMFAEPALTTPRHLRWRGLL